MSPSRRSFVKSAATTAAALSFPTIIPRHVLGGANFVAPSDKVNVGIVGVGGQGRHNTLQLLQLDDVQVTAIADPAEYWNLNDFYYKAIAGRGPVKDIIEEHFEKKTPNYKVAEYVDFRKMLEKESSLDAVLCATPDHTHAFVASNSMRAGKHVYVEKPMAHNLWENRKLAEIAKETGVATQMGNMGHSSEGIRQVVELLRAGAIGEVKESHSWCHATRWTNGLHDLPLGSTIPQPDFDWDLWLGPREEIPYHEDYTPVKWRDFWRFGCGAIGDFACHDMDATVWAYDLAEPESVQIYPIGQSNEEIVPHGELGYFDFKAKGRDREGRTITNPFPKISTYPKEDFYLREPKERSSAMAPVGDLVYSRKNCAHPLNDLRKPFDEQADIIATGSTPLREVPQRAQTLNTHRD